MTVRIALATGLAIAPYLDDIAALRMAFCAVDRPPDHPRRPGNYQPPGALWRRHGFIRRPDIVGNFAWRDLGDADETTKPMVFWIKELA